MNVSGMSLSELRELDQRIQQLIEEKRQLEVNAARREMESIASTVGLSLHAILGKTGKRSVKLSGASPYRYQNPDNPGLRWSGRGRPPGWIRQWIEAGRTMDALRIPQ